MNIDYSYLTTRDDLVDHFTGLQSLTDEMNAKLPKLPKTKAANIFELKTGETFDMSLTTRANIDRFFNDHFNALTAQDIRISEKAELDAQVAETQAEVAEAVAAIEKIETIDTLLADLHAATDKNAKKNIRAKLRRLGFYIGAEKAKMPKAE